MEIQGQQGYELEEPYRVCLPFNILPDPLLRLHPTTFIQYYLKFLFVFSKSHLLKKSLNLYQNFLRGFPIWLLEREGANVFCGGVFSFLPSMYSKGNSVLVTKSKIVGVFGKTSGTFKGNKSYPIILQPTKLKQLLLSIQQANT